MCRAHCTYVLNVGQKSMRSFFITQTKINKIHEIDEHFSSSFPLSMNADSILMCFWQIYKFLFAQNDGKKNQE